MWFLYQLEPDSPFYNICNAIELRGRLNVPALTRAIQAIVARHEILRTTYHEQDDRPIQTVRGDLGFAITLEDLTHLPDPRAEAMRRCAADAQTMFDLGKEIIRARLYKLADDVHILYWNIHHIASDAGSAAIILREIRALYPAFAAGAPDPLPPLGLQHSDIAAWQRSAAHEQRLAKQLEYWKQKLAGEVEVLDLPTGWRAAAGAVVPGRPRRPDAVVEKNAEIAAFAKAEGTTPYVIWLAAFYTVLHRYSGKDDLVIGTTVSSRNRVEIEGNVGFLTNTVALRTSFAGNPVPRGGAAIEGDDPRGAEQPRGPVRARRRGAPPGAPGLGQPVLPGDVHVRVTTCGWTASPSRGCRRRRRWSTAATVKFELELEVLDLQEHPGAHSRSTTAICSCARRRADPAQYVEAVVMSGIRTPDASVLALDMLSAEERRQILDRVEPLRGPVPGARDAARPHRAAGGRRPRCPGGDLRGRDALPRRARAEANQLAHLLREHGIGRNVPVGISIERSFELVVGLVAIAQGGRRVPAAGSDVPARAPAVHAGGRRRARAPHAGAPRAALRRVHRDRLCLDRDAPAIAAQPPARCEPSRAPPTSPTSSTPRRRPAGRSA